MVARKLGDAQWYLSMGDLYGIFALGVPVDMAKMPTTGRDYFKLRLDGAATNFQHLYVTDVAEWEAAH
eukprot:3657975-Pyramimonas_sp.AAC.1